MSVEIWITLLKLRVYAHFNRLYVGGDASLPLTLLLIGMWHAQQTRYLLEFFHCDLYIDLSLNYQLQYIL